MKHQALTSERWRQVKEIFQAAVEIPAAEREAYLAGACEGDPSLRTEIESLIAAHEEPGSFLGAPAFDLVAESAVDVLLGKSLGRYRILSLLGRGGMGEVYRAKDTTLGRDVAIKVLPSGFSIDRDRLRRFEREARAASALNHPNIITIHEFGQEEGVHFIVSEFIEGETLRRRIGSEKAPGKRMNAAEILELAIQITGALNAAHEAGIVHRDVKPENVMVRPDGLVKVLDFGLAKLVERRSYDTATDVNDASEAPTASGGAGVVMGAVNYMSPEQARGERLDARSDIFSLGVALYEMAAGRSPFARGTVVDTIASILEKEPPPLAQFTSGVPEALELIIRKMLGKDREDRYQTARELLDDLRETGEGRSARRVIAGEKRISDRRCQPAQRRNCDGRADCGHRRRRLLQQKRQGGRVHRRLAVHQRGRESGDRVSGGRRHRELDQRSYSGAQPGCEAAQSGLPLQGAGDRSASRRARVGG
jgi:hypothetical protein